MYRIKTKEETKVYLGLLSEREKELFMGLAQYLISADGENSVEEEKMILAYCEEMQISYENDFTKTTEGEIIEEIEKISTIQAKKIISFELMGLALVDGCYHGKEQEMIRKMNKSLELDENFEEKSRSLIMDYITLQKEMEKLF